MPNMNDPQKTSSSQQVERYFDQFAFLDSKRHLSLDIPKHLKIELYKEEGGFIFDSNNGLIYTINQVAAFILSLIIHKKGQYGLNDITQFLKFTFDVTDQEAQDDIIEFFCHLKDFGMEVIAE